MTTVFDMYNQTYQSIDKSSVIAVKSQLLHSLEGLVDATSLGQVLEALSELCSEKAAHVAENWQDKSLERAWLHCEGLIGVTVTDKYVLALD